MKPGFLHLLQPLFFCLPLCLPATTHATPPNIILILADDMGYSNPVD